MTSSNNFTDYKRAVHCYNFFNNQISKISLKSKKKNLSFAILAIRFATRSLRVSWFRMPTEGTNTQTNRQIDGHQYF